MQMTVFNMIWHDNKYQDQLNNPDLHTICFSDFCCFLMANWFPQSKLYQKV